MQLTREKEVIAPNDETGGTERSLWPLTGLQWTEESTYVLVMESEERFNGMEVLALAMEDVRAGKKEGVMSCTDFDTGRIGGI